MTMLQYALPILIILVGLILPHVLHDDHFPRAVNAAIATLVLLVCAYLLALMMGHLSGRYDEDVSWFVLVLAGLLAGPLRPLVEVVRGVSVIGAMQESLKKRKQNTQRDLPLQ